MKKLLDLINILKILQSQIQMIQEITDNGSSDLSEIKKKYESLGEFKIELNSKNDINYYVIDLATKYILNSVFTELIHIISKMMKKLYPKNILNYLNDVKIIVKNKYFF